MTSNSRRALLLATVFGLSLLSCGREVTGPGDGLRFGLSRTAALAIDPQFPQLPSGDFASDLVPFVKVRMTLRQLDNAIVKDTTIDWPSNADSVALTLTMLLPLTTPSGGLPVKLAMAFVNAAGDTVFRGGPAATTVKPVGTPGASDPVAIPVSWVPRGAMPASIVLTPPTGSVTSGTTTVFRATALDAAGDSLPGTPIVFTTDSDARVTLVSAGGTSTATWLPNPGTVRVVASTLNAKTDTSFITVSLPVPTQLAITAAPTTAVAGITLGAITVAVRDAGNALTPLFTGPVSLTLNAGTTGATLLGTATVTAVGGVATFTDLRIQRAATGLTLTASSGAIAPATSAPLTITPAAPAALVLVAGNAQSGTVGQPLPDSVDVQLRDAFANPIAGSSIAFSVTSGGGSISPTSVVTDAMGRARVRWTLGSAVGSQSVTAAVTANPNLQAAVTAAATAGAAAKLLLTSGPIGTQVAGVALQNIVVEAQDALGNRAQTFTGTVSLALAVNPGATTPTGVLTVAAVAGVATFSNIAVTVANAGYRLAASSGALVSDTTLAFAVVNAAASKIEIISGGGQSAMVGAALAAPLVVRITDSFGNNVAGVAVTWTMTTGLGTLGAASSLSNASGYASTTLTLSNTAGIVAVSAAANGLTGSPQTFAATALPGAAAKLLLTSGPIGTQVAGVALQNIVVEAQDALGNRAQTFTGSVRAIDRSVVDTSQNGDSVFVTAVGGVVTFTGKVVETAGTFSIRFSAPGLTDAVSNTFAVTPAAPARIVLLAGANNTGTAGKPLPYPVGIFIEDQFYNHIPGLTVTWAMVRGADTLAVHTSVTDSIGVSNWLPTLPTSVGQVQILARSAGLNNSPITEYVVADVAAQLTMSIQPTSAAAAAVLPASEVRSRDQYGNMQNSFTGNVTATIDSGPSGAVLSGTTTVVAVGGAAVFSTLALDSPGSYRLRYAAVGLTNAVSAVFTVTGPPAGIILVSGGGQSGTVMTMLTDSIRVRLIDASGNLLPGRKVTFFSSYPTTTVIANTNAAGEASSTWSLGYYAGTQQMLVYPSENSGLQLTVSATGTAGAAVGLGLTTPAAGATSGSTFTTQPIVQVRDAWNNLVTTDNTSIVTMTVDGAGTVIGTGTATAVGGVATFENIGVSGLSSSYSLTFQRSGLTSISQGIFVATPILSWTGAVNNDWGTTGNWNLNRLPVSGDSVVINGSQTVNLASASTVRWLTVPEMTSITIASGATLTVVDAASFGTSSTVTMTGGTLTGTGSIKVGGTMNWSGGTMAGFGNTHVAMGATLAVTGAPTLSARQLLIHGTMTLGGTGFNAVYSPSIAVQPTGTLSFTSTASYLSTNGLLTVNIDSGTVRKHASAGLVRVDWPINNSGGLIEVVDDSLDLRNTLSHGGGNVSILANAAVIHYGRTLASAPITIAAGGVLSLQSQGIVTNSGRHVFTSSSSVSGLGTLRLDGADSTVFAGGLDVDSLTVENSNVWFNGADTMKVTRGAYLGGGSFRGSAVLGIRGNVVLNEGLIDGTGTFNVRAGGNLTVHSMNGWTVDVNNTGKATWGDYDMAFGRDTLNNIPFASMRVRSGGIFDIMHGSTTPRELLWTNPPSAPYSFLTIDSGGTVRKSAGNGVSKLHPRIVNYGLFEVVSGTINVVNLCQWNGTKTGQGSLTGMCGTY